MPSPLNYEDMYNIGQTVYYLHILPNLRLKEVLNLNIRTIDAEFIIGCVPGKSKTVCIDINEKNNIFDNEKDAIKKYKTIKFK